MRTYVISLLLFFCTAAGMAQPVIEDGFEDGNFTENPSWRGDIQEFTVSNEDPNHLLQLQGNSSGGSSYLSTASTETVGSWDFYYRYDASSAPSASNRASIFLMSDRTDLEDDINGYALQVGRTGDDTFELVRYDNGVATAPILSDTTVIFHNNTGYRVRVTRSAGGLWQLEVGSGYSGQLFDAGETATDNTHTTSAYFGVLVNYTSTRARQFFFDFKIDLSPFTVTGTTLLDNRTIEITFNREIDTSSLSPASFSLYPGAVPPASVMLSSANQLQLHYNDPLPSDAYTLTVTGVLDLAGNTIEPGGITFFVPGEVTDGDVLINEFMYDPPSGLAEYVEIRNTSNKYLDLSQWEIGDEIATVSLGEEEILLEANGFLVLSADTLSLNRTFGYRPYQLLNLPSLNNTGDAIRLFDQTGRMADSLFYSRSWGGRGVAIERRSATLPAFYAENWGDAPNGTGTPGMANEIPADTTAPSLKEVHIADGRVLQLNFSERLTEASAKDPGHYQFTPTLEIRSLSINGNTVTLELNEPLAQEISYTLTITNISDLFGNSSPPIIREIEYLVFSIPESGDIVINEIMYRPLEDPHDNRPDQSEYLELRNTTEYVLSLEGLVLHDAPDERGKVRTIQPVTTAEKWIPPQGIALIYPDTTPDFEQSSIAVFFDIEPPPDHTLLRVHRSSLSLASNGDAIYIADSTGATIDSVYYDESWQNPNIYDTRGIALERISPVGASNHSSNWGSSITARGGTPFQENSIYQARQAPSPHTGLSFTPNPFSPDDDGFEDHLFIHYKLEEPDYLIRAEIYDRYGRFIHKLADSLPAGFEGTLMWDGRKENGGRNNVGIYIIILEAYNSANGKRQAYKETVVLARRFK